MLEKSSELLENRRSAMTVPLILALIFVIMITILLGLIPTILTMISGRKRRLQSRRVVTQTLSFMD